MTTRPTADEMYNAGVRMNLARGTADERPATAAFMALIDRMGSPLSWPALAGAFRIVRWRIRHWWRDRPSSAGPSGDTP